MVEPRTASEILDQLLREGYVDSFRTSGDLLHVIDKNFDIAPEELEVEKIYRFEGETDLDDEEIIFVLRCPKRNIKGTFLVAFGPKMDHEDSAIVHRLKKCFEKRNAPST